MDKKVPEKNVNMKDEDVFFVYEKRINKCIKEGCEGVVKYGLIMKVNTGHDETINCFECNKCHMKYTPYPNFNRLVDKHLSNIFNAKEVAEWQEHTKKKVELRKNSAAKLTGSKFGSKRVHSSNEAASGTEHRSTFKRTYEKKSYDRADGQNSYGKKSYEKRDDDKSFQKNRKPYSAKPQTYTVKKGNIIITRAVDSAPNNGMQMKRRPSGPKSNPDKI